MNPMNLAALVAVFFLSIASAPKNNVSAAEQACPPYSDAIRVRFNKLTPDPVYNHTLGVTGIRNLFLTRGLTISGDHQRALGVTYARMVFYMEAESSTVPQGNGYCVYLKSVDAEFGWRRMEVHVANDYRKGTCEYNAILDHENQHVSITRNALSAYAPHVRAELERELAREQPVFTHNPRAAFNRISDGLYGRMRGVVDRFSQYQASRNAVIDSSSNYGAIADLCPNWDQNPRRFR